MDPSAKERSHVQTAVVVRLVSGVTGGVVYGEDGEVEAVFERFRDRKFASECVKEVRESSWRCKR